MYRVDRLNRQYEKLRESAEEPENVGPLEASVKNLQKEILVVSESSKIQKWCVMVFFGGGFFLSAQAFASL